MDHKPYMLIVTGRPGSGKSTFSKKLGDAIFMPVISRDEIKEGYVHTLSKRHADLPAEANKTATDIYFGALTMLIDHGVSLIAEAAFQHKLWSAMLEPFMEKARIYLLICKTDGKVALDRFVSRGLNNPAREYFHGDKGVDMARKGAALSVSPYEEPRLDAPTFHIDTTGDYHPSIDEIIQSILGR